MAATVYKSKAEIPTIDIALVTIEVDSREFGFDTANSIEVEPQLNETDPVQLIIKGKLKAQKRGTTTLTGNQITLTDNDTVDTTKIIGYKPSTAASGDTGKTFKLNAYSAQYNAAGQIVQYEKITYPNCTGVPVAFNSVDDEFRAPEYTINSAPDEDEEPYVISYVDALPMLAEPTA